MATIKALTDCLTEIWDGIEELLEAETGDGEILDGVNVRFGRKAEARDLPVLFANPMEASAEPQRHGEYEDWVMPIFLVAMVKDINDQKAGQKAAAAIAAKGRSLVLGLQQATTQVTYGITAGLIDDVLSMRFATTTPMLDANAVHVATATLAVKFSMIEDR